MFGGLGMEIDLLQAVLERRRMAFILTDRALTVIEVEGQVALLPSKGSTVGQRLLDLVPELVGSEDILARILAGEVSHHDILWANRETPEGETLYLTLRTLPWRDAQGHIVGLIQIVEDLTEEGRTQQSLVQQRNELRLLREQLARQNLALEAANAELRGLAEAKSAFVSAVAHELRGPLTSIGGYLDLLLDEAYGSLLPDQRHRLEMVRASAARMTRIVGDLLDLTRIDLGRMELLLRPTEIMDILEPVIEEYQAELSAKGQRLEVRIAEGLPQAMVDRARAGQIVANLLGNASKYSPPNTKITITAEPAQEDGFICLSVADQGVGIAERDQARLFERFHRLGDGVALNPSGIGLGLAIVKSLVELHGGRVWVESQPGRGSTFYALLPAIES